MNINKIASQLDTMSNEKIAKQLSNIEFVSKLADAKFYYGKDSVDEFLIREASSHVLKTPKSILQKTKEMFKQLNQN